MEQVYQESLDLHRKYRGKLSVESKVELKDKKDLSLAYTPGVGQVCLEINHDPALAREYTIKRNTVAVVSDGSAVLGLGNLGGLASLPVMEGKAALFKRFGNVDAFPICLDTQDTEEIIATVKRIAPTFGGINLEDISAPRCFEIERRLRAELNIPVMHDDQHGTAVVVLAGLINALKVKGVNKTDVKIVVNGIGAAGVAVTKLLLAYGFKHIVMCDTQGALYKGREGLTDIKSEMAEITNIDKVKGGLEECVKGADIFIGVSKAGALKNEMVKVMAEKPIIFALANPVPEIMPDEALEAGAFIVATGRSDFPNQVNNVLAFPGIFRGALDNEVRQITDKILIRAAEGLAAVVQSPSPEKILPTAFDPGVAECVAAAVTKE
jgi:malate dehydrogenase (oxaloacetate-decarboxylating)